jgi:hypothetical protein
LGPRPPLEAAELFFNELAAKSEGDHDVVYAGVPQEPKVTLEQAPTAESQQALGKLTILRLLQAKPATCG